MALLMTYYNFLRPHKALKFSKTIRTPAMQAGLAKKCLSFREVFTSQVAFLLFVLLVVVGRHYRLDYRLFSIMALEEWPLNNSCLKKHPISGGNYE